MCSASENTDDCEDDRECEIYIDSQCFTSLECFHETHWKPKPGNIFVVEWDNVDEKAISLKIYFSIFLNFTQSIAF